MNKPLLILSTAAAAFMFASCDNNAVTNPVPTGTATIKGAIISDLDEDEDAGDPTLEKIPAGVDVYFLDANTDAVLGQVKTTAEGYTFDVNVGAPTDIRIVVGDFSTQINVYDAGTNKYVKKDALYNRREDDVVSGVIKGGIYIENVEISQPQVQDF